MSLINDALKRAKQAQQDSPDAPQNTVQFRPVEPGQHTVKKNNAAIWIAIVIITGLIIGFVLRQVTRERTTTTPNEVKAREIVPANPAPQDTSKTAPAAASTATPSNSKAAKHESSVPETAAPAPIVISDEPRIVPKLQAIVFDPKRPSAIITGKSVFVGDKLGDFRVVGITQESVKLVSGGQTNVLVLGE
jgi:cytoskeletal protein RodZ